MSFEFCDLVLKSGSMSFTLCVVYRAPPTRSNKLGLSQFFEDFPTFPMEYTTTQSRLLLVGDLNFHLDDNDDHQARRFMNIVTELNFKQLVSGPTHIHGHTLDVVITREGDDMIYQVYNI